MDISPNFTIGSTNQAINQSKKSNSEMNMEDFLKIMAASLRMPALSSSEGGKDSSSDYMNQMIQFSTMEQLKSMSDSVTTTMLMTQQQQAISMIGKEVTVLQEGQQVTGTVEKTRFFNGYATIQIDGKDYYMNNILEIGIKKA
ncbi:hypothetical protein BW727_101877 [Jeotgalibaca dankookensis]|uniref:Flagellar basal body rod modification protein n=1 Tax=Jeotgalibaca dankookensis TaxID=708126 RepID=A0A1S6IRM0_9LACT|nr:hypothetical protein [Jeotgalibaca dankookensis]AQS54201.1 hypothetical protein BW727_101877 [Jeotgalibaca dankookensis]